MTSSRLVVVLAMASAGLAQTRLELGRPVTKPIRPDEVHRYTVEAPTGTLVRGSVRQSGTAIRVRGYFPDGAKIRSFAGAKGTTGFRFVVEMPGAYQIEVTAAASTSYTISLDQIQPIGERLNIAIPERYHSPRIQVLQKEIAAGHREALDTFWKKVQSEGTPLAE